MTKILVHNTDGFSPTPSARLYRVDSTATTDGKWGTRGAKLCSAGGEARVPLSASNPARNNLELNVRLTTNYSGDNTAHI